MKVLMLQGYYEPEAVSGLYLVTNLVEDLNKNNHLVDIVTPIPSRGVSDEIRNEYKNNKKEVNSSGKTTSNSPPLIAEIYPIFLCSTIFLPALFFFK